MRGASRCSFVVSVVSAARLRGPELWRVTSGGKSTGLSRARSVSVGGFSTLIGRALRPSWRRGVTTSTQSPDCGLTSSESWKAPSITFRSAAGLFAAQKSRCNFLPYGAAKGLPHTQTAGKLRGMTTIYCEATHPQSEDGCFERPDHEGQHRGWTGDEAQQFFWEDEKEPAVTFTDAELGILLAAIQPVKHFFPDLEAKLHRARAAVQ